MELLTEFILLSSLAINLELLTEFQTEQIEFANSNLVCDTFQYPSAIPSLRGSDPPINAPVAGSIIIACPPPIDAPD